MNRMITPANALWQPSLVSPRWQHLSSRLTFAALPGISTRNLVNGDVATTQLGSVSVGNLGRSWLTTAAGDRLVWPYRTSYGLSNVPWSVCIVFTPLTESGIQDPILGQWDNPNQNGGWNIYHSSDNDIKFNFRTTGTTRNIDFVAEPIVFGESVIICITRSGDGNWRQYKNGRKIGNTVTETNTPILSSSLPLVMSNEFASAPDDYTNGHYYAVYIWRGYELTPVDAAMVGTDPFGIIRPSRGRYVGSRSQLVHYGRRR